MIRSAECITARHLFEQTVGTVAKAVGWTKAVGRCENLPQLVVELSKCMGEWTESGDEDTKRRLVLVFDGIDHQREMTATLLPALARLGEIVSRILSFLCSQLLTV
jgi:origin recognition complex subunit 5